MVRHFFPQSGNRSITSNTNYPPQDFPSIGGEPMFDDEEFVIGGMRDSVEYVIGPERDSVDFQETV